MLLKNLINSPLKKFNKLNIKGLALNSKHVKKGYIFFAMRGNKFNGENYINKAIDKGAVVIVCSNKCKFKSDRILIIKKKILENLQVK